MHFRSTYIWDKGDYYERNEDSLFYISVMTGYGPVFMGVVADGVGSMEEGLFASGYAVNEMEAWFYNHCIPYIDSGGGMKGLAKSLVRYIRNISFELKEKFTERHTEGGTTLTVLLLFGKKFLTAQVGDSVCFRLVKRPARLTQSQSDEEGRLLQAVGYTVYPNVEIVSGRRIKGEAFLLCSDGFMKKLGEKAIFNTFDSKTFKNFKEEKLLSEILSRLRGRGERDNITAICTFVCNKGI